MADEDVVDSPTGWVRKHIQQYDRDPAKGAEFHGYPALLLTTRGRKSGKLRRTALYYAVDGGNYVIVASLGGSPKHPLWYLNLVEHPEVELQVGSETIRGRARTATAEERPRLWDLAVSVYPTYASYQKKTSREIPVVIVEPG